ncbi:hypothetical protein Tco_0339445 [Tanacetum coccineum]
MHLMKILGCYTYVQEEVVEGMNATNETANDEAGVILTDEQNDFLFADASRMEEIEELVQTYVNENTSRMHMMKAAKHHSFAQNDSNKKYDFDRQIEMYKERTGNIEIPLNVRDSEETLEDAFKSQQKMNEKMNDPIAVANKQNCWTIDYKQLNALYNEFVPQKESFVEQTCSSSSYIPFVKILETKTMPSELPLINELFNIKVGFEKLFLLIKQNSKRASMFYTSKEEIALNDFCRDQVKPLLNELLDYFDGFQNLFQRDIKE